MPKGFADDALDAIACHRSRHVLLGDYQAQAWKRSTAVRGQQQHVLARDLEAGILEDRLVIFSTQQTQLLAKAKVRHRFYFISVECYWEKCRCRLCRQLGATNSATTSDDLTTATGSHASTE